MSYAKHPKEKNDLLEKALDKGIRIVEGRLYQELAESKIAIGARTTAVLEAGLYQCIVIKISHGENPSESTWRNCYVVRNEKELAEYLEQIKAGILKIKNIDEYSLKIPENIIESVNSEIQKIINATS